MTTSTPSFAAALTAVTAVVGPIIPPSIPMILYGVAAEVSIGELFIAGVVPGLLIGGTLMLFVHLWCRFKGLGKNDGDGRLGVGTATWRAGWALLMPVIILGGILSGIFTATESAAIAVLYAFFVTMFIYRDYKWSELPKLMHRTVKTVTIVMILIGFAAAFGYLMTLMQIPMKVTAAFTTISDNRYVILALINVMLLALGTLMDMAPLILILTPILLPVVTALGIDPVHFGMIMITNLAIGLISPPVSAGGRPRSSAGA